MHSRVSRGRRRQALGRQRRFLILARVSPDRHNGPTTSRRWGGPGLALVALVGTDAAASDASTRYTVEFGHTIAVAWTDFDRAPESFAFSLDPSASADAIAEFGYSTADLQSLTNACSFERCAQADLNAREDAYYRDHGLVPTRAGNSVTLAVDIPAEVHRNAARVRPLAIELSRLTKANGWGADQQLGAMIALTQTAIPYKRPPAEDGGRQILGFYPAPRALEVGSGDCDTKSALIAAVMSNFSASHMVGVHVPGHYLVGIDRIPQPGQAFIQYRGEPYVLIEAAGPALLPPGTIAPNTQAALDSMAGVRIDPLF